MHQLLQSKSAQRVNNPGTTGQVVSPAYKGQKQEDVQFKAILDYTARCRLKKNKSMDSSIYPHKK